MRILLLTSVAALALAGCKNNSQHDNTMNVGENLTAENIVSNDVTAIDAVTGDAANMAADVDMNFGLEQNGPAPVGANEVKPARHAAEKPAAPETSTTANTTANAQ